MSAHLRRSTLLFLGKDFRNAPSRQHASNRDSQIGTNPICSIAEIRTRLATRTLLILFVMLLMCSAAFAQGITFVQSQQCKSTGTSVTCAYSSSVAAGDALMIVVSPANTSASAYTLSVSDNLNGTWTQNGSTCFSPYNAQAETFYYLNSQAGSVTVTITSTTSTTVYSTIAEYSGVATSNAVDVPASCTFSDSTSIPTPGVTTTNASDLILASPALAGNGGTITVGSPYTIVGSASTGHIPIADQIVSSAGAYTGADFTLQYGDEAPGLITAFKAFAPVAVTLTPGTATLYEGQTQQFTATVTNTSNTGVTWSVSPSIGTITAAGLYTPPATSTSQQTVTITATSEADATKSASAAVTLMPSILITWPTPAAINAGTAISATQLNATASVPGTFAYTPAAGYIPAAGTMTLSLLFTPTDTTDYGVIGDNVPLVINGPAPIITTVAGTGTPGDGGNGGAATQAELFGSDGLAIDAAGNVYIAERYNSDIRKIDATTGDISVFAGKGDGTSGYTGDGGAAASALLAGPAGMHFDVAGENLYFADEGNSVIRKINMATTVITTVAGNGTAGYSGDGELATASTVELNQPWDVALDSSGDMYIADGANYRVRRVDHSTGLISTFAGTGSAGAYSSGDPATATNMGPVQSLFVDSSGNVFIGDAGYRVVREVLASNGNAVTIAGGGTPGFIGFVGDGGPALNAYIWGIGGLAPDASGNFYVGEIATPRVRKVTTATGFISTVAGDGILGFAGDGGAATSAEIGGPDAIAFDSHGNMFITGGDDRVREVMFNAVVTWPTPAPITYGTALSSTQLNATANVPGTFVYTPASGTVLPAGGQTLSVTFTPTDTTDYSPVTQTVTLTVDQAVPTLAWAQPSPITYGTALSSTQLDATASVPGTFAYDPAAGTIPDPGDQVLSVLFTPSNTTDYNVATASVPLTVTGTGGGSGSTVYQYSLSYYTNSNIETQADSSLNNPLVGSWTYQYDNLNRLESGQQGSQTGNFLTNYCWSYDNFGNRWQQMGSNETISGGGNYAATPCQAQSDSDFSYAWTTYSSSANNNQIVASSQAPNGPSYDAAGDVTNDGNNQYLYNADGQICAVEWTYNSLTAMTGYIYDADGNRVAKGTITSMNCDPTTNGFIASTETDYVRDQSGNPLSEFTPGTNGTMTLQSTNVWANGILIATDDSTETHFYMNDWLGTRRVQTNYAGAVEQTCSSLPFGDSDNCTAGILFTGKERDAESGNDYFGARYYGSVTGRFLSPDFQDDETDPEPVPWADYQNPQSLNLYSYVYNNPLSHADNDGHDVSICPAGATQVTMACQTISDDQYKAAQQADNGGLNVPSLVSVGANGSGNITDSNGNVVGTAIYSSDSGVDFYANQGAFQTLGAARNVVNVMGAVGLTAASFAMPEVLSDTLPEVEGMAGVGRSGASLANKLNHIFGKASHDLDGVVEACGGRTQAYEAMQNAAASATQGTSGPFQVTVQVGGESVVVRGTVIDGVVKIGTAFKP